MNETGDGCIQGMCIIMNFMYHLIKVVLLNSFHKNDLTVTF